jgi:hypothetical protein
MMRNMKITAKWRRGLVVVLVPLTVMACGSDSDDEAIPSGGDTSAEADGSMTTTSDAVISAEDVDGAIAEKVLLAAVLLGVGDVDVALSEGLVTADEVDLAVAALETGTLAEWSDRAAAGG